MRQSHGVYYIDRREAADLLKCSISLLGVLENYDIHFPSPYRGWDAGERGRVYYVRQEIVAYGDLKSRHRREIAQRRTAKPTI